MFPYDAAVPGCLSEALTCGSVFPATLGRQRKHGERWVVARGLHFGVLAEESNESGSILIHDAVLHFCPGVSRGTQKRAEPLPREPERFVGGTGRIVVSKANEPSGQNPSGGADKAERR